MPQCTIRALSPPSSELTGSRSGRIDLGDPYANPISKRTEFPPDLDEDGVLPRIPAAMDLLVVTHSGNPFNSPVVGGCRELATLAAPPMLLDQRMARISARTPQNVDH